MLYQTTTTFVSARMRKNAIVQDLRFISRFRLYSTVSPSTSPSPLRLNPEERESKLDKQKERDAEFRRRKTEWKRRQGVRHTCIRSLRATRQSDCQGETFLDHLIMHVRAGV
jgi:hypothetical protein